MKKVFRLSLNDEMEKFLAMNKPLRKDVRKFIAKLTSEAANCQAYSTRKQHLGVSGKGDRELDAVVGPIPDGKNIPLCLWKPHSDKGLRHLLSLCRECPKDEKDKLFEAL